MSNLAKYTRPPVKDARINFKGHHLVGVIWPMASSNPKNPSYDVEMMDNGMICCCYGFAYRGKCRHIKQVVENLLR